MTKKLVVLRYCTRLSSRYIRFNITNQFQGKVITLRLKSLEIITPFLTMLYEKTHTTKRNKLGKFADDRCKANCEGFQWVSALALVQLVVKRKKRP